jgi:PadR family transcriptional regulator, regulatory protein AphA
VSARNLSPAFILLGYLALQPAHGYEVHQRLTSDLGQLWRLSQSQIYSILNRLEKQGLLTAELQPQSKSPDRRYFHLTLTGRRHFDAWLHSPTRGGLRAIRLNFVSRLYFAHLLEKEIVPQLIKEQFDEIERTLAREQAVLALVPIEQTFNRMALELRVRHLAVALEWLAKCAVTFPLDP